MIHKIVIILQNFFNFQIDVNNVIDGQFPLFSLHIGKKYSSFKASNSIFDCSIERIIIMKDILVLI